VSNGGFEIRDNDFDGMASMAPADARARMLGEYIKLRNLWFPEAVHGQPATFQWLLLAEGSDDLDSGYSHSSRVLRVVIRQADLQLGNFHGFEADAHPHDIYINCANLPNWRVFLAHELCHEYQFAVLNDTPDEWGTQTFAARGAGDWPGPGHTAAFYTAIRAFAQHFDLDVDHVIDSL
jgi:hypothetical protein